MVVVAGTLKGSPVLKPELFIITLIKLMGERNPCAFSQSAGEVELLSQGEIASQGFLSVMRGEEGEVIVERAGILLALSNPYVLRYPAPGSVNQEVSTESPLVLHNENWCPPLPSCRLKLFIRP